jgi:hypothetical protein
MWSKLYVLHIYNSSSASRNTSKSLPGVPAQSVFTCLDIEFLTLQNILITVFPSKNLGSRTNLKCMLGSTPGMMPLRICSQTPTALPPHVNGKLLCTASIDIRARLKTTILESVARMYPLERDIEACSGNATTPVHVVTNRR